jgi:hypothetical protein
LPKIPDTRSSHKKNKWKQKEPNWRTNRQENVESYSDCRDEHDEHNDKQLCHPAIVHLLFIDIAGVCENRFGHNV